MSATLNDVRTAIRAAESLPVKERRPAYAKAYVLLKQVEKQAFSGTMPLHDIQAMRGLVALLSEKV